jgi:hypothetical protein
MIVLLYTARALALLVLDIFFGVPFRVFMDIAREERRLLPRPILPRLDLWSRLVEDYKLAPHLDTSTRPSSICMCRFLAVAPLSKTVKIVFHGSRLLTHLALTCFDASDGVGTPPENVKAILQSGVARAKSRYNGRLWVTTDLPTAQAYGTVIALAAHNSLLEQCPHGGGCALRSSFPACARCGASIRNCSLTLTQARHLHYAERVGAAAFGHRAKSSALS